MEILRLFLRLFLWALGVTPSNGGPAGDLELKMRSELPRSCGPRPDTEKSLTLLALIPSAEGGVFHPVSDGCPPCDPDNTLLLGDPR